jgi:phage-related minor tail protein
MDEGFETMLVGVRADTAGFARDVAVLRGTLEEGLGDAAMRAGGLIEASLARAIRTGKLGFDDLKRVALNAMSEIAGSAIRSGIGSILGGGNGGGGLLGLATAALGTALGLPGRAIGGPVTPGRGYMVGERGPELFVPGSAGVVTPLQGGGAREVRVSILVNAPGGDAPGALARSGRQVARAVRAALEAAEA